MRSFLLAVVLTVVALLVITAGKEVYRWKQQVDTHDAQAAKAYEFLARPAATDATGKTFTNADVLQDLVRGAVAPHK